MSHIDKLINNIKTVKEKSEKEFQDLRYSTFKKKSNS